MTDSTPNIPNNEHRKRWLADVNLALVAIIWGVNMPIMKFALGRMDEFLFNALRLSFSAIVPGICVLWQNRQLAVDFRGAVCNAIGRWGIDHRRFVGDAAKTLKKNDEFRFFDQSFQPAPVLTG